MFWAILHKSVVDAFFWVQAAISLPPLHAPSVVANIARVQMTVRLNLYMCSTVLVVGRTDSLRQGGVHKDTRRTRVCVLADPIAAYSWERRPARGVLWKRF